MKFTKIIENNQEKEKEKCFPVLENIEDLEKYTILDIYNETDYWLCLFFYEDIEEIEYKYQLCIDFKKFQIEYLSNSYFDLEEKILKYSFLIQNENNKDYFEDIRRILIEKTTGKELF